MVKQIVETKMTQDPPKRKKNIPKPKPSKKVKVTAPETPPPSVEEEHPTEGGKTIETLKLMMKDLKQKKEPTEKQIAARERAKEKREQKKKEEAEAIQKVLEEERKKAAEIEARKIVQAEKRRLKREGKKASEEQLQKPIDSTPAADVGSVSLKKEPSMKYIPPPEEERLPVHKYKAPSFSQVKRMGVWTQTAPTKRFK